MRSHIEFGIGQDTDALALHIVEVETDVAGAGEVEIDSGCGVEGIGVAGLPVLVHLRRDFLACDKALRAQIAQPAVRSFRVVMLSPILNDDAGFA